MASARDIAAAIDVRALGKAIADVIQWRVGDSDSESDCDSGEHRDGRRGAGVPGSTARREPKPTARPSNPPPPGSVSRLVRPGAAAAPATAAADSQPPVGHVAVAGAGAASDLVLTATDTPKPATRKFIVGGFRPDASDSCALKPTALVAGGGGFAPQAPISMASNTPRPKSRSPAAPDRTYQPRRPPPSPSPVRREIWAQPLAISTNMASGSQLGTAAGPGNITSAPPLVVGAPETVAGDGVMEPRRRHHTTRHYQFEEFALTVGAYNCEGFLSACLSILSTGSCRLAIFWLCQKAGCHVRRRTRPGS